MTAKNLLVPGAADGTGRYVVTQALEGMTCAPATSWATRLQVCKKSLVLLVRTDPEPDDGIAFLNIAHGAVVPTDPYRDNRFDRVHPLKMKAWVTRICDEKLVRDHGLVACFGRKQSELFSERRSRSRFHSFCGSSGSVRPSRKSRFASAAIRLRRSWERAKRSTHRFSDSSSASAQAAKASCSCSGSFCASATTFSRSLPIALQFYCDTFPSAGRLS